MSSDKYHMPYIYRVENLVTGQFYYGARYIEKTTPELDLWLKYFTSSKDVKKLIKEYGVQSFTNLILETHADADICYQKEQDFIKEYIDNPLCLNKQYTMCGKKIFLCKGHTNETKEKMSIANKGKPAWNKGISPSDNTRQKISLSGKGVAGSKKGVKKGPRSLETRRKISETNIRKNAERRLLSDSFIE
jgi:uncharacterized protein YeaO (DUF488 family)